MAAWECAALSWYRTSCTTQGGLGCWVGTGSVHPRSHLSLCDHFLKTRCVPGAGLEALHTSPHDYSEETLQSGCSCFIFLEIESQEREVLRNLPYFVQVFLRGHPAGR